MLNANTEMFRSSANSGYSHPDNSNIMREMCTNDVTKDFYQPGGNVTTTRLQGNKCEHIPTSTVNDTVWDSKCKS